MNKYYLEPDHESQQIAWRRLSALSAVHQHLAPEAWHDTFELGPKHAEKLTASDLLHAGAGGGEQWMLIALWGDDSEVSQAARGLPSRLRRHHPTGDTGA